MYSLKKILTLFLKCFSLFLQVLKIRPSIIYNGWNNLIKMTKYIVDIFDANSTKNKRKYITIENIFEILKYTEQYFIHKVSEKIWCR